ncbi:MAG: hypothetical protein ACRD0K_20505 [Egibacteraceae bacterium]
MALDVYVEPDNIRARQMFVDVADNAKGISSARRSRFDGSKIANRTLDRVMDHALLKGRVDLEQDRITDFFRRLDRDMIAPVPDGSVWRDYPCHKGLRDGCVGPGHAHAEPATPRVCDHRVAPQAPGRPVAVR